ncbi:AAA family ATPase [Clostridium perfringens]
MNFEFKNLGPIISGSIDIKDLTIICGENNTGKTYISYALYGFYELFDQYFKMNIKADKYIEEIENEKSYIVKMEELFDNINNIRDKALNEYKKNIYKIFNSDKDLFKDLELKVDFLKNCDKDKFLNKYEKLFRSYLEILPISAVVSRENNNLNVTIIKEGELSLSSVLNLLIQISVPEEMTATKKDVFMLPAERSGINIFFKELNINRNNEIFALSENMKMKSFMKNISKYSLPISNYINFLNNMNEAKEIDEIDILNKEKHTFNEAVNYLEKNIIGGEYTIDKDNNIRFIHNNSKEKASIAFHVASSTAKTLFSLDYYLNNNARKGDILIIDEPELNLHPDNQRKLTRLLGQIVNRGIKLIISTHSDYIIKELNNLIVLGRKFEGYENLMSRYNYSENELLDEKKIGAYVLNDRIIKSVPIEEEGIIMDTFDNVINSYNESSDDIYYMYEESLQDE